MKVTASVPSVLLVQYSNYNPSDLHEMFLLFMVGGFFFSNSHSIIFTLCITCLLVVVIVSGRIQHFCHGL